MALGIAGLLLWYCGALVVSLFLFTKGIDGGETFAHLFAVSILMLPLAGVGAVIALFALLTGQRNPRLTTLALCINAAPCAWVLAAKAGLVWPYAQ